jgi:hypothetical protein
MVSSNSGEDIVPYLCRDPPASATTTTTAATAIRIGWLHVIDIIKFSRCARLQCARLGTKHKVSLAFA